MSFNKLVAWLDNNDATVKATLNVLSLGFGSLMTWAENKISEEESSEELKERILKEEAEHKAEGLPYVIEAHDWVRAQGLDK